MRVPAVTRRLRVNQQVRKEGERMDRTRHTEGGRRMGRLPAIDDLCQLMPHSFGGGHMGAARVIPGPGSGGPARQHSEQLVQPSMTRLGSPCRSGDQAGPRLRGEHEEDVSADGLGERGVTAGLSEDGSGHRRQVTRRGVEHHRPASIEKPDRTLPKRNPADRR